MNDIPPFTRCSLMCSQVVECVSAHLLPIYQDVVPSVGRGRNTQLSKGGNHQCGIFVVGEVHAVAISDIRQHHITHICIYAAASAFPAVHLHTVPFAVFDVHLVLNQLVPSEYHAGFHLPDKEGVVNVGISCNVLFHSQIEA